MPNEPSESDLLVKFEQDNIPPHYKSYYSSKRHNFFATIQQFSYIWKCFTVLDEIWQREFEAMQRLGDTSLIFPMILFMNAHAKTRIAFELACSVCVPEAHSIMRDAIESFAYGNRLASDPKLCETWLKKNDDQAAAQLFRKEFEDFKAKQLFAGLPDLHRLWKEYSEFGSHTNINSIFPRFAMAKTATDVEFRLNYTGGEPQVLVPALFEMILAIYVMEGHFFGLFESRLKLGLQIPSMRERFEREKERVRLHVIKTFNLKPPSN